MDVGFYLGELLMQQGEVSVPGLGYFVQVRMSGHYEESERKFYPPYHQAQFDVQSIDDDALAEYVAIKKNISVASAKYFAEKYITNLKQQALIGEVPIGNLGHFYTELTQLTFRPAEKIIDDTIFYGFEPVSINKIGDFNPVPERPKVELVFPAKQAPIKPAITEEVPFTAPTMPEPVQENSRTIRQEEAAAGVSPDFFEAGEDEEEAKKSPLMLILVVFISVMIVGLGVFALYRYKPDTFAKVAFWKSKTIVEDDVKPKLVTPSKPDTIAAVNPAADSLKKADSIAASVKNDTTVINTTAATPTAPKTQVIIEPLKPKKKDVIISQTPVTTPATSKTQVIIEPLKPKKKEVIISQTPVAANKTTILTPATSTVTKPAITKPKVVPADKNITAMDRLEANTKVQAAPSDAVGTRRFEVYAFNGTSVAETNAAVRKLKNAGYDPRLVTDATGTLYHISIGHFTTKEDARAYAVKAIETGKMPHGEAYGIEIIPNK